MTSLPIYRVTLPEIDVIYCSTSLPALLYWQDCEFPLVFERAGHINMTIVAGLQNRTEKYRDDRWTVDISKFLQRAML